MQISYTPFRLLFRQPFRTAHGERDGTDAIFVRVRYKGLTGYGEAALPPYVAEDARSVMERIAGFATRGFSDPTEALRSLEEAAWNTAPGARSALHMALLDALGKNAQAPIGQILNIDDRKHSIALFTLGLGPPESIPERLLDLPEAAALKVKVDGTTDAAYLEEVLRNTQLPLFIDGNQGLQDTQALRALLASVPAERLLGVEQPFAVSQDQETARAQRGATFPIYADESLRNMDDLFRVRTVFAGVNIKLQKCGGLDRAQELLRLAAANGLRTMVGCMSESSLGCTAMAQLQSLAGIADLDGPWLLENDPFVGLQLKNGVYSVPAVAGIGAELREELSGWV